MDSSNEKLFLDCYAILGLSFDRQASTSAAIKTAYRNIVTHGRSNAFLKSDISMSKENRMKFVHYAAKRLSPQYRDEYDMWYLQHLRKIRQGLNPRQFPRLEDLKGSNKQENEGNQPKEIIAAHRKHHGGLLENLTSPAVADELEDNLPRPSDEYSKAVEEIVEGINNMALDDNKMRCPLKLPRVANKPQEEMGLPLRTKENVQIHGVKVPQEMTATALPREPDLEQQKGLTCHEVKGYWIKTMTEDKKVELDEEDATLEGLATRAEETLKRLTIEANEGVSEETKWKDEMEKALEEEMTRMSPIHADLMTVAREIGLTIRCICQRYP